MANREGQEQDQKDSWSLKFLIKLDQQANHTMRVQMLTFIVLVFQAREYSIELCKSSRFNEITMLPFGRATTYIYFKFLFDIFEVGGCMIFVYKIHH